MRPGCNHKYYNKGRVNQKRADIIIDFSRPDVKTLKNWTEQDREEAKKFLAFATETFENFKKAILNP